MRVSGHRQFARRGRSAAFVAVKQRLKQARIRRELPNFVARLVGMFDAAVRDPIPELGLRREMDNGRTRAALRMTFIPIAESVVATGRFLIDNGLLGRK